MHGRKLVNLVMVSLLHTSYHNMRNYLLDKCFEEVKGRVNRIILNNLDFLGCTIVSDGWSNVQCQPLINIILVSPRGESSGQIKTGGYITQVIASAIESVGATNVKQVVMDNAKNCSTTRIIIQRAYPHIYATGCNTHSLNLVYGICTRERTQSDSENLSMSLKK